VPRPNACGQRPLASDQARLRELSRCAPGKSPIDFDAIASTWGRRGFGAGDETAGSLQPAMEHTFRRCRPTMTHILFPFDFSAQSQQATPFVSAMAHRLGARVTLMSVLTPFYNVKLEGLVEHSGEALAAWKSAMQPRLTQVAMSEFNGIQVEQAAESGEPGYRITEFAHTHDVDLIMMPTHGVGMFRSLLLGSATAQVLHDAHRPVWTAAHMKIQHARPTPQTVLCAFDAMNDSTKLLRWAADFSHRLGAALKLLHVVNPISDWPTLERARELQEQVRQAAEARVKSIRASAGVDAPLRIAVGDTAATVAEQAREEDADLIVIGRGSLPSSLGRLRTHAYGIIQRSPCPVLSV
jgi:nucleotide-binding universal stress UspA family protein